MSTARAALATTDRSSRGRRLWRGYRATLPVAIGVAAFGVAYGAVATRSMTLGQAQLMSATVFAGTAQFVAASLLADGAPYLAVLIAGLLMNLRMVLQSAALTPHMRGAPAALRPLLAHLLTDESFAVSLAEFERRGSDVWFYVGSGLAVYSFWQLATAAGYLFGAQLPAGLGLDYALPASLVCLLLLLVRGRRAAVIALLAAVASVLLRPLVTGTWATLVATVGVCTLGLAWKEQK